MQGPESVAQSVDGPLCDFGEIPAPKPLLKYGIHIYPTAVSCHYKIRPHFQYQTIHKSPRTFDMLWITCPRIASTCAEETLLC